jgi:hypothetical protein
MSVDFDIDEAIRDPQARDHIRAEIEKLLRDHEARWHISLQAPAAHRFWRLTAKTAEFERQKLLDNNEKNPGFIRQVLLTWLSEFMWQRRRQVNI